MDKVTTNSGIPVFGEVIKLLNKQEITKIAEKTGANRYSKRLDAYQHLVILLYAVIGQLESLRDIELAFLPMAHCIQQFGLSYMVRRSTLSDANSRRSPQFFENVYNASVRSIFSFVVGQPPCKRAKQATIYHGQYHHIPFLSDI